MKSMNIVKNWRFCSYTISFWTYIYQKFHSYQIGSLLLSLQHRWMRPLHSSKPLLLVWVPQLVLRPLRLIQPDCYFPTFYVLSFGLLMKQNIKWPTEIPARLESSGKTLLLLLHNINDIYHEFTWCLDHLKRKFEKNYEKNTETCWKIVITSKFPWSNSHSL